MKYYFGIIDDRDKAGKRQILLAACKHDTEWTFVDWMKSCFFGDEEGWSHYAKNLIIFSEDDLTEENIKLLNSYDTSIMDTYNLEHQFGFTDLNLQYFKSVFTN